MEWLVYLLLFLKGAGAGALYNFCSLTSLLLIADFIVKKGKRSGILCGLGISTTHILWSSLAAFALSLTFINLHENQHVYTLIGSFNLILLCLQGLSKEKKKKIQPDQTTF